MARSHKRVLSGFLIFRSETRLDRYMQTILFYANIPVDHGIPFQIFQNEYLRHSRLMLTPVAISDSFHKGYQAAYSFHYLVRNVGVPRLNEEVGQVTRR